jgi:hypothetical protein
MYACICETGSGFFVGVCRLEDRHLIFHDPPPLLRCRSGGEDEFLRTPLSATPTSVNQSSQKFSIAPSRYLEH